MIAVDTSVWVAAPRPAASREADILKALLDADAGAIVWSLDPDFERMRRIGLIDLYEP